MLEAAGGYEGFIDGRQIVLTLRLILAKLSKTFGVPIDELMGMRKVPPPIIPRSLFFKLPGRDIPVRTLP
jgi:hypothetical protein